MSLAIHQLLKTFGAQKAVDNISFSVQKGEIVGFLGPNGAGKSTTMKMLTGYLQPDGGSASVCGIDVTAQPIAIKQKIGYLAEANPLYYDLYVREYLGFIAGIHAIDNKKQAVEEVIALTGLTLESKKQIGQLSKGYKQRVGLAAAMVHNPEVLILDEPTSGLDPNQIIEIRNVIKAQGANKTVLFSSHILQEVEAICNRVIIINKGVIVADDSIGNLKKTTTGTQVSVAFKETIPKEWLLNLPEINNAYLKDDNVWILDTKHAENARKQLLHFAVAENLNIVSIQTVENNLESIFRELTH